ncbi:MAG: 16S rRNA (cytosine(1402)-N(4))-methyltransferase RsmH [Oligoflexia bacterium]|nr:16S rRNA (cytosine(1402)-N(4))-methyltransferase RsmH [Oligoflexia bacterium]
MHRETSQHISIMVPEVLEALNARAGGKFLDCTLGGGGHTRAILEAHPNNSVTASDRDVTAIERARPLMDLYPGRLQILHSSFAELGRSLQGQSFAGILADLGVSTDQLKGGRGFSFHDQGELDMRMDARQSHTAADFVNRAKENDIYVCLRRGGVGSEGRAVARAIVAARPVKSAAELTQVIERSIGGHAAAKFRKKGMSPATVVFQAIRMAVNSEIEQIEDLLGFVPKLVRTGSRFVVLTFHSIEDRLVTHTMRGWESGGEFSAHWPGARTQEHIGKVLYRKAVVPGEVEVGVNPNARSARLRAFEFC